MKRIISITATIAALLSAGTLRALAATGEDTVGAVDNTSLTIWISVICGVLFCAIITMVVILALRNRKNK